MNVDLNMLERNLWLAEPEKTVPDDKVNPYLLNVLLRRLLDGEDMTYGEVDTSRKEKMYYKSAITQKTRQAHIQGNGGLCLTQPISSARP